MKALRKRTTEHGIAQHTAVVPRIYEIDDVQKERIERSRKLLNNCIGGRKGLRIVELGCGTLDISGPFSKDQLVYGVECNQEAVQVASERWPEAHLNVLSLDSEVCDIIVLCEFLEHIENPSELVANWLPKATHCVISHPLDGDLKGDLSAGEHQWSFSREDFVNWFTVGGHSLIESEVFTMGGYEIILGRGGAATKYGY